MYKKFEVFCFFFLIVKDVVCQINLMQHFEKCKLGTSAFDDCVKSGLNEMTPYFQYGLPEYGVDPFDPFHAEQVHQKRSGPFFNYKLVLRNVTESGWTQSQVTRFRSDLPKNLVQVTQFFPDKRLNGIYEIDGTFFGQKVKNSGSWNMALFDYVQTLSVSRKLKKDPNGKLMSRPPIKVKCNIQTCKKLELHIGNLAGGRTIVGKVNSNGVYCLTKKNCSTDFYLTARAGAAGPTYPNVLLLPYATVHCQPQKLLNMDFVTSMLGDVPLGERENMLDWVINNAWQPGFVILAPIINDLVGTAFTDIFNKDFQYFPFESVFQH